MFILERDIMIDWQRLSQSGGSIINFFRREEITEVIIYGAGYIGLKLYEDIKDTDITVRCFIDKSVEYINDKVRVYNPSCINEISFSGCAIIISSVVHYSEIFDYLKKNVFLDVPIYGIEDVIYDEIVNITTNQR